MAGAVIVHGLDQIQRDFAKAGPKTDAALRAGLKESAEPVAQIAKQLSLARIGEHHGYTMARSPQWAEVRIGVTRHAVYIVPKKKGVKSHNPFDPRRRPNLVELMLGKSFEPALEVGGSVVENRVGILLRGVLTS